MIEGAMATLTVEKAIAFRRVKLPPGEYGLCITAEDGASRYLVLEPKAKPNEGGILENTRRKVENTSPALEKTSGKKAQGKEEEELNGNSTPTHRENDTSQGRPSGKPVSTSKPVKIRAPLTLSPTPTPSDTLSFELNVSGKGSRLRVVLHAGSTDARTSSLRLGDK